MSFIVAVDGSAGSGKGTLATAIAKKFNLMYLDTGATYRCITLEMLNRKIGVDDTEEIKKFSTSSLITRTTNDVTQIEMFLGMGLQLLIKSPITAVWAVTKILNKSWEWSTITGIAVLILLSVVAVLIVVVVPKFKIIQKLTDNKIKEIEEVAAKKNKEVMSI